MHPIPSVLKDQERSFAEARDALGRCGFVLGGNWEYDHGSFDCPLDEARKVWLRLPFRVTAGVLDGEARDQGTRIRFDEPFVLKHLYREGPDPEAMTALGNALTDQFQKPADPDAPVEPHWIERAKEKLREAETACPA